MSRCGGQWLNAITSLLKLSDHPSFGEFCKRRGRLGLNAFPDFSGCLGSVEEFVFRFPRMDINRFRFLLLSSLFLGDIFVGSDTSCATKTIEEIHEISQTDFV